MFVLVVLLLAIVASAVEQPVLGGQPEFGHPAEENVKFGGVNVFVRYLENGPGTRVLDNVGEVESSTGKLTPISTNMVYLDLGGSVDGVSTLDERKAVFYYTSDFGTTNMYGVRLGKAAAGALRLQPPLDTWSKVVASLEYDHSSDSVLISRFIENREKKLVPTVLNYPTDNKSPIMQIDLPPTFRVGEATVFNAKTKTFYAAGFTHVANTTELLSISDFGSKNEVKTKMLKVPGNTRFIWNDVANGLLYGLTEYEKEYFLVTIDPSTGAVDIIRHFFSLGGLVLDADFSEATRTLFFTEATTSGCYLWSYRHGSSPSKVKLPITPVDIAVKTG